MYTIYMYYHFCPEKNTKNKKEVEEVGRHSKMLGQYSVRSVTRAIVVCQLELKMTKAMLTKMMKIFFTLSRSVDREHNGSMRGRRGRPAKNILIKRKEMNPLWVISFHFHCDCNFR